jgi:hypothetical protein
MNMRTWFRDTFNTNFNTQKLGGFDPYMNEYVLSINDKLLPSEEGCIDCGLNQTFTLSIGEETTNQITYCVNLGSLIGETDISFNFTDIDEGATIDIQVDYDGNTESTGPVDTRGVLTFDKNNISVEAAEITLTYTGDMTVSVLVDCVQTNTLNIVEVVVTNNSEAGQTIHTQYRYTNGTFIGPLLSNLVLFDNGTETPLVSRYSISRGFVGSGGFPPIGSTMILSTNKITPDSYNFDVAQDKFKYFRSNTLYDNNSTDIQTLLNASATATPILGASPLFYANFIVPSGSNGDYLYLIWDLRDSILTELCFSTELLDSCCDCSLDNYYLNDVFTDSTSIFTDANMTTFASNGFYSLGGIVRELVGGVLLPSQPCAGCSVEVSLCYGIDAVDVCCNCDTTCDTPYNLYLVTNNESFSVIVYFYNEEGILSSLPLAGSSVDVQFCSIGAPYSDSDITVTYDSCDCIT